MLERQIISSERPILTNSRKVCHMRNYKKLMLLYCIYDSHMFAMVQLDPQPRGGETERTRTNSAGESSHGDT